MSFDREFLFPGGRRNYSRISFRRCSDICITYQIIISAVENAPAAQGLSMENKEEAVLWEGKEKEVL